jgi:hypothetical protein
LIARPSENGGGGGDRKKGIYNNMRNATHAKRVRIIMTMIITAVAV